MSNTLLSADKWPSKLYPKTSETLRTFHVHAPNMLTCCIAKNGKNLDRETSVTWVTIQVTANFEDQVCMSDQSKKGADCT